MEKTPFVKLLCRKTNPYDPKMRQMERNKTKSNEPFFMSGIEAEKEARKLRDGGVSIIRLSMQDVENMVIAGKIKEPVTQLKLTSEMQQVLYENRERYLDEHCDIPELDYEQYREQGEYTEEKQKKFVDRCMTVAELDSMGYTRKQIKLLYKVIMADYDAERIAKIIPPESEIEKIRNLVKNF